MTPTTQPEKGSTLIEVPVVSSTVPYVPTKTRAPRGIASPAWHFTITTPVILKCDLCPWQETFGGSTPASIFLSALYSHHAFSCSQNWLTAG